MLHPSLIVFLLVLVGGCATTAARPLKAETSMGSASGAPGRVLVISASCGALEQQCRSSWAPAVDGIVVSGLEFRGYSTIDPATLRRDEATRSESTVTGDSTSTHEATSSSSNVGVIAIVPVASGTEGTSRSVSVTQSKQKTVVVNGATLEELPVADQRRLLELAGAQSVLTTRVLVGANQDAIGSSQRVEVMVKLSEASEGGMRWATRCSASTDDFASVDAAIEAAAQCAVSAITKRPEAAQR